MMNKNVTSVKTKQSDKNHLLKISFYMIEALLKKGLQSALLGNIL